MISDFVSSLEGGHKGNRNENTNWSALCVTERQNQSLCLIFSLSVKVGWEEGGGGGGGGTDSE